MSEAGPVNVPFVEIDATQEQIHRLKKWAYAKGNDNNPLALAVRMLFEDRSKVIDKAANLSKRCMAQAEDIKHLRGYLAAYENRGKQ